MSFVFHYHPASPPSQAVWMLLEELKSSGNFEYIEHIVDMPGGEHRTEDFKKEINMFGEVPAITQGDFKLGQSRAILRYVVTQFSRQAQREDLYPPCAQTRARIDMYLDADADCYVQFISYLNPIGVILKQQSRRDDKLDDVKSMLQRYDDMLGGKPFMMGDKVTIVDFSCLASMGILRMMNFEGYSEYKNIVAWQERMKELPSVQKCFVKPPNIMKEKYLDMYSKLGPSY